MIGLRQAMAMRGTESETHARMVQQFAHVMNTDEEIAQDVLHHNKWDLDSSICSFLDMQATIEAPVVAAQSQSLISAGLGPGMGSCQRAVEDWRLSPLPDDDSSAMNKRGPVGAPFPNDTPSSPQAVQTKFAMGDNAESISCARCGRRVCDLGGPRFVQHQRIGCGLVLDLQKLDCTHKIEWSKPGESGKKFKFGELRCRCGADLGNIQNNVAVAPFRGKKVGMLKFKSMHFVLHSANGDRVRRKLTGRSLCSALQDPEHHVRGVQLTAELVCRHGLAVSSLPTSDGTVVFASLGERELAPPRRNFKATAVPCAVAPPSPLGAAAEAEEQPARKVPNAEPINSEMNQVANERAVIKSVKKDQHSNLFGFCQCFLLGREHESDVFFYHGSPATNGFKARADGNVASCGLELAKGDTLGELKVEKRSEKLRISRATLVVLDVNARQPRLRNYLQGLTQALDDSFLQTAALSILTQETAGAAIWGSVAKLPELLEGLISVLEVLVQVRGSNRRAATAALGAILLSDLTLPDSCLHQLMQRPLHDESTRHTHPLAAPFEPLADQLQQRLVAVALAAFHVAPARRRLFQLLSAFLRASPERARALLPAEALLPLLGASLPPDAHLACYHWRELPLQLTAGEMRPRRALGAVEQREGLRVVRRHGAYAGFDEYMATYVGLLREEAFAAMRDGLCRLLAGRLDARDMLVVRSARLLAMSPPITAQAGGGSAGAVLELRGMLPASCGALPMFGSLLAVAPQLDFERRAVWATVASATSSGRELCIHAELCPGLNEQAGWESDILAALLHSSGELTIVESPTFYRAYAPAMEALQALKPEELPFFEEIVLAQDAGDLELPASLTVDASVVFRVASAGNDTCEHRELRVPAADFLLALDQCSHSSGRLCVGGTAATSMMDPSQCRALKDVFTRRIAIIRGPPGTGKTFVGVRALQLLLSTSDITSEGTARLERTGSATCAQHLSGAGPALLLTYKNVALDDFLEQCLKVWPEGVARIGGKAKGTLEQRHLGALARAVDRSEEHMAARRVAAAKREEVEAAAMALGRNRFFSAETLLSACPGCSQRDRRSCPACAFLYSLVAHDPTSTEDDVAAAVAELEGRAPEPGDNSSRLVSGLLQTWMPTARECAMECRSGSKDSTTGGDGEVTAGGARGAAREGEQDEEEKEDRSRYAWFDGASTRLDELPDTQSRGVFALREGHEMAESERSELLNTENVWELLPRHSRRVRFMHAIVNELFSEAAARYDAAMEQYTLAANVLRAHEIRHQARVVRGMKVVGMTISGASINRELLEAMRPRIVFVEEAAEVLEPLLLAALGPWVQRLVMIGDDKQIPPQVTTHVLARDFFFNTSLMKRMIDNDLQYTSLCHQARMMPEFAALLLDVYPEYRTSERVRRLVRQSPPPGVLKSMFFWDVECASREEATGRSRVNHTEVLCATALAVHMVRSGVEPKRITVLAPYSGQVLALRESVHRHVSALLEAGLASEGAPDDVQAATEQLAAMRAPGGTAAPGVLDQCLRVGRTLLTLGRLGDAESAFALILKESSAARRHVESPVTATEELSSTASRHIEHINRLREAEGLVGEFWDGISPRAGRADLLLDAITAAKELDALSARWRASAAADAAAAASLQSQLATRIMQAPVKLNDRQRQMLEMVNKAGAEHLKALAAQEKVCVSSIDKYQGSENDFVIVSLVRCNDGGEIGFLKERARRVVAQSRARSGMYFVGSCRTMEHVEHWRSLTNQMIQRRCLGPKIALRCARHDTTRDLSAATDVLKDVIKNGMCGAKCSALMACGKHECQRRCHGLGHEAERLHAICRQLVQDRCAAGLHDIQRKCFQRPVDVCCTLCEVLEQERLAREQRELQYRKRMQKKEAQREVEASREIEREKRQQAERERMRRDQEQRVEIARTIAEIRRKPPGLRRQELLRRGETLVEFLSVQDRTEKYVQAGHHSPVAVVSIEKIDNPTLELKFWEAKTRLCSGPSESACNLYRLFHGTGPEGVKGIPQDGFRLPTPSESNMFGRGLYFATDSSKSAQSMYTKGSGCLLLCDVLMGKPCTVDGLTSSSKSPLHMHLKKSSTRKDRPYLDVDLAKIKAAGFDSVFAPRGTRESSGVQFDEMIVYDPAQAIPRYIIHFSDHAQDMADWRIAAQIGPGRVSVQKITEKMVQGSSHSRELMEFNFATGHFFRLVGARSGKVKQVDVYDSPAVHANYRAKEDEFRRKHHPTEKVWVFHGTETKNVAKICSDGFRVGGSTHDVAIVNGAAHGQGVYTAIGPETPMWYSQAGSGGGPEKAIILCLALTGKPGGRDVSDSWRPNGDWVVFKTAEQLLPKYVLHFA